MENTKLSRNRNIYDLLPLNESESDSENEFTESIRKIGSKPIQVPKKEELNKDGVEEIIGTSDNTIINTDDIPDTDVFPDTDIFSGNTSVYVGVSPTVRTSDLLIVPSEEYTPDQQALNKLAQAILSIWVNVVKRKRCPLGEHGKMTNKYLYRTRCSYDRTGEPCPNKECAFYGRKETGHQTIHYPPCRNGTDCEPIFNVIATIAQLLSDQPLTWRPQKLYGLCKGYHSYSEVSKIIHDYLNTAPDVVRKYNTNLEDAIVSRNIEKNFKATYQNFRPVSVVPSIIEKK